MNDKNIGVKVDRNRLSHVCNKCSQASAISGGTCCCIGTAAVCGLGSGPIISASLIIGGGTLLAAGALKAFSSCIAPSKATNKKNSICLNGGDPLFEDSSSDDESFTK